MKSSQLVLFKKIYFLMYVCDYVSYLLDPWTQLQVFVSCQTCVAGGGKQFSAKQCALLNTEVSSIPLHPILHHFNIPVGFTFRFLSCTLKGENLFLPRKVFLSYHEAMHHINTNVSTYSRQNSNYIYDNVTASDNLCP